MNTSKYGAIDKLWISPHLNKEAIDPICEDVLGESEKLVCGAFLTKKLTLSILFTRTGNYDKSDYVTISKRIATEVKANIVCD